MNKNISIGNWHSFKMHCRGRDTLKIVHRSVYKDSLAVLGIGGEEVEGLGPLRGHC